MAGNLNYETANSWTYNDDPANGNIYGRLYTWDAAITACPSGWHLPSDDEWMQLGNYVGAQGFPPNGNVINGAGNALKSCRQVNSPLGGDCNTTEHPRWSQHSYHHGFDEFGFSAFPGGFRPSYDFYDLGDQGLWWSSTDYSLSGAWSWSILSDSGDTGLTGYGSKASGYSVRCLKN